MNGAFHPTSYTFGRCCACDALRRFLTRALPRPAWGESFLSRWRVSTRTLRCQTWWKFKRNCYFHFGWPLAQLQGPGATFRSCASAIPRAKLVLNRPLLVLIMAAFRWGGTSKQ
eukprot:11414401-Alexandrium_andersonii.AAC.1